MSMNKQGRPTAPETATASMMCGLLPATGRLQVEEDLIF